MGFPHTRLRRLRGHPALRELLQETRLSASDFVLPLFVHHDNSVKKAISAMPGYYQLGVDHLAAEMEELVELGILSIMLFGLPHSKDPEGSSSWAENGVIQRAIRTVKAKAPSLLVIVDLCFCQYTSHGHCGKLTHDQGGVDNDTTLSLLVKQAVSLAQAGADVVAPSGMMDGMVQALRSGLDQAGFSHIPILSYAVKYASGLYAPFREAAESPPKFGDRKTYQLNPANVREALRETALDIEEGADIVMVKPAGFYLDVVSQVRAAYPEVPVAAYQVGGEYAMIKAASQNGWIDEQKIVLESLIAIKRAGASFIITYFAKQAARWLQEKDDS